MNHVNIDGNTLRFRGGLRVSFQRTLRIPDDGKSYPLPPGLGTFPLRRVDDFKDRVPSEWLERGGVFLPMYQREAMWLAFSGHKPRAVKVGIGKVCAITGERWSEALHARPQDYLVAPPQPWLDGIAAGKGTIRQFVAMPLGMGYTVEGQVTGEERFGGIQIKVFEPKPGLFRGEPERSEVCFDAAACAPAACGAPVPMRSRAGAMGLAAGGRMKQKIYPDPHGIESWDAETTSRIFVHIVNSELWREITGEEPPPTPVTAKTYAQHGLPWFDVYDEGAATLDPTSTLSKMKSVKDLDEQKFGHALQDDDSVDVGPVKKLLLEMAKGVSVRDGDW